MRRLIINCPNCGSILRNGECNYCGTKVRYANELDLEAGFRDEPVEIMINIKKDNSVIVLPVKGFLNNITISIDTLGCYYDGDQIRSHLCERKIELTFEGVICEDD